MKTIKKIINPPCNSHVLRIFTTEKMSEKSVILIEDISASETETESVAAVTDVIFFFPLMSLKRRLLLREAGSVC